MEKLLSEQIQMFERYMERELTVDEVYLIKNSFKNGFAEGKAEQRKEVVVKDNENFIVVNMDNHQAMARCSFGNIEDLIATIKNNY